MPAALPGGWQNRDTALAFADYAGFMAGKLTDRVKHIMTVNELRCFTDLSYMTGGKAPGLKLPMGEVNQVRHHGVLAHGLGVQAIRAHARPGTQVGLADNATIFVPALEMPEHIDAVKRAVREENAMSLTAIMEGRYIDSYLAAQGTPQEPAQLVDHWHLHYPRQQGAAHWVFERVDSRRRGKQVAVPVQPRFVANNSEVLRDMACAGLGIALLPDFSAQHAVRQGDLVEILPQWRPVGTFGRTIFALRPYTHRTPRNVRVLLDYLLEAFAGGFDADPASAS